MRVLHVNNHHRGIGGSDSACNRLIGLCREYGLDVGVFTRDSRDLPHGLYGKTQAFVSGLYARSALREFDQVLHAFRPDVVHVHELFPLISPWILPRCAAAGIPTVMTCYDFRITCPVATHYTRGRICHACMGGREYHALLNNCRSSLPESLAYGLRNAVTRHFGLFKKYVTRFIAFTEFSRRWLLEKADIAPGRIATIPVIVPTPATGVLDPAGGAYVGYAGRFVPEKGVEILIEACRKSRLPLRLAGDKPSHPAIRAGDDAVCVETREPGALTDFYRGARVLVVPSLWEETFATVLSEAKSHGISVLASRIGALQDLVEDEVTGLLFDAGNVEHLADKLQRLWHDPELCRRLGAAGRLDVRQTLCEDVCMRKLIALYREIRGGARPN